MSKEPYRLRMYIRIRVPRHKVSDSSVILFSSLPPFDALSSFHSSLNQSQAFTAVMMCQAYIVSYQNTTVIQISGLLIFRL
ncbi:hypothetical protein I7I53_03798 [Histoplasma capsulatum var. duboisii H88]|uniref:Uncharacterized protein n=1 Tax=Ajellomyces capsulatus (strain H88) TaxID=544711 RepID=A0A8A1LPU5_AJEC8|nr:hypothetical protein I7I53_03798 [Histoplasma capsulatum var. duboisii H88]